MAKLGSYPSAIQALTATWFIKTDDTAFKVAAAMEEILDDDDGLIVNRVGWEAAWAASLAPDIDAWLQANLQRRGERLTGSVAFFRNLNLGQRRSHSPTRPELLDAFERAGATDASNFQVERDDHLRRRRPPPDTGRRSGPAADPGLPGTTTR